MSYKIQFFLDPGKPSLIRIGCTVQIKQIPSPKSYFITFCLDSIVRECEVDRYVLLYLKCITNKDLLYDTWDSAQCYVAARMGREGVGRE